MQHSSQFPIAKQQTLKLHCTYVLGRVSGSDMQYAKEANFNCIQKNIRKMLWFTHFHDV